MTPNDIDSAAEILRQARLENKVIDCIPETVRPGNIQEAYAIQDRFIELLGWEIGGWYCACTNVSIQTLLDLKEPYYARLLSRFISHEPAVLNSSDFPPIVLECEYGFRLGKDLPRRKEAYSRDEVAEAIATVHPTIEVVAGHLKDWPKQDVWSVIADNGTDGALIYGEGRTDWRNLDLINMPVVLEVNRQIVREGSGRNVLGDPLEAFVWFANARSRDGEGLKAGNIHNTGTTTDIIWIEPGDKAKATFEGLGAVSLELKA